ncbi:MAG TPA: hypothetical protein VHB02_07730 [Acidimicrobiales bacterium]|nr:hypothetical protein [Acidimicrobiales bacterium]
MATSADPAADAAEAAAAAGPPGDPAGPAAAVAERDGRERAAGWAGNYVKGVVTTLVIIGAERLSAEPKASKATAAVVLGVVAMWLAHLFADLVADWVRGDRFSVRFVWWRAWSSWAVLASAVPATAVMLAAGAGAWSTSSGLAAATWVGLAGLTLIAVWTAIFSPRAVRFRVAYAVGMVVVGWLIVGLEVWAKSF